MWQNKKWTMTDFPEVTNCIWVNIAIVWVLWPNNITLAIIIKAIRGIKWSFLLAVKLFGSVPAGCVILLSQSWWWRAGSVNIPCSSAPSVSVGAVWDGSRPVTRGSWEKDSGLLQLSVCTLLPSVVDKDLDSIYI